MLCQKLVEGTQVMDVTVENGRSLAGRCVDAESMRASCKEAREQMHALQAKRSCVQMWQVSGKPESAIAASMQM